MAGLRCRSPPVTVTLFAWVIELLLSDIPPVAVIIASSGRRTVVVLPVIVLPVVIVILTAETDVAILMVLLVDIKILPVTATVVARPSIVL